MLYDAFICHASEDKVGFVRQLAEELSKHHLEIWYDEFSLTVGDSLREKIDEGLSKSRFGIVILSPHFFTKGWTKKELNGLFTRQLSEDKQIVLPIWHNIGRDEVIKHSPMLADMFAINSDAGLSFVCRSLLKKIRPSESPLIAARDELIRRGIKPPVISDEWWLDVVESSGKLILGDIMIPKENLWGNWSFPLPHQNEKGVRRGLNLAWTALQATWSKYAEENKICQITHPEKILSFIKSFAGLKEICYEETYILSCYAPQLTMPEFSGEFSSAFDDILRFSMEEQSEITGTDSGSTLTVNGAIPECDTEIALRHKNYGNYKPYLIGSLYIHGRIGRPNSKSYSAFEYLIWFLSQGSNWMPSHHKNFLLQGIKDSAAWIDRQFNEDLSVEESFLVCLSLSKNMKDFLLKDGKKELLTATQEALKNLGLSDSPNKITNKILDEQFIEAFFQKEEELRTDYPNVIWDI